ncbi:MAG: hypothetical protein ABIH00_05950 [Armatimonadota bacterium]
MNKSSKNLSKAVYIILILAVIGGALLFPLKYQKNIKSQSFVACPIKGTCLYKCPNSCGWKTFENKSTVLPLDSSVMTKENSKLGLILSKDTCIYVTENSEIKVRLRHKRCGNALINLYKLAKRDITNILGRKNFKLTNPTVLSTI